MAGTPTGEVRLWQAADHTLLMAVQGPTGVVWSVALSADGRLVASGEADGMVRLWEAERGSSRRPCKGRAGRLLQ